VTYQATDEFISIFVIYTGEVGIGLSPNAYLATFRKGKILGRIGQILKAPNSLRVIANTSCITRVIEDETLSQK
jgi:hypothetical protein